MKILWLLLVLHTVSAQPGFGRSYLRNSRLCHQWSCINTKLNLPDSLPTAQEFSDVLRRILPEDWHNTIDKVVDICYNDRPRRYTNTCPGQAIMHCAVDQLVANCPEEKSRKEDACAPVNSIAGFNIMFSQSRYENLERNMPLERRPEWFLKNYFNSKCCNLPVMFNSTALSECGFTTMMQYHVHNPQFGRKVIPPPQIQIESSSPKPVNNGDGLQIVTLSPPAYAQIDPLDCCVMSSFIQPSWRQECNFQLSWEDQRRLVVTDNIETTTLVPTTSTSRPVNRRDLVVVPHSCEKEACVFSKLNILNSGSVDIEAFTKLLDNLTTVNPEWTSAKGRVVTTCLRKPIKEYDSKCEINNLLACTFDVLTENCPNATKDDQCKHKKSDNICQISSSKYRPRNRRNACLLPELVNRDVLRECGLISLSKVELVHSTPTKNYQLFTSSYKCQNLTPSTSCVLTKMGVLNQFGFTDYFKMKDHIRHFASTDNWPLVNLYLDTFMSGPLYKEHCNSPRKFLNVLESMLMTCPASKRKNTPQCQSVFNKIANTPASQNANQEQGQRILKHFHNIFFPAPITPNNFARPKYTNKLVKKPIYNYGILSDKYAPKVTTIDVKPKIVPKVEHPLVLLPVYMRIPHSNLSVRPLKESEILRSPFWLHNQIAQAHSTTPVSTASQAVYSPK